jgi:hypothetical protein
MTTHIRGKATAFAVLAAGLLSPAAASAATHHASAKTAHVRAERQEVKALEALRAKGGNSRSQDAISDLIQNLEWDLSSQGFQAILGDLPLVGDYG